MGFKPVGEVVLVDKKSETRFGEQTFYVGEVTEIGTRRVNSRKAVAKVGDKVLYSYPNLTITIDNKNFDVVSDYNVVGIIT